MYYVIPGERPLWCLNPLWILCGFHLPIALASAILPAVSYELLWGVPKYFSGHILLLTLMSCVCLAVGYWMGMLRINKKSTNVQGWSADTAGALETLFKISLCLTVIGYILFLISAYHRGFSAAMFVQLIQGQRGTATALKNEYFKPSAGVTSLTQFGMAAGVIGVMVARLKGWRRVRNWMILLVTLAFCRAIFVSERLALLEVLLPLASLALRLFTREINHHRWKRIFVRITPAAAPCCLYVFFAVSEYFRSWANYYVSGSASFWEFAFGRLSGYYLTSMNNAAYLLNAWNFPSHLPFFTCSWIWHFPILSSVITDISYGANARTEYFDALLTTGLSAEFNNPGGMLAPQTDFGLAGGLIFWIVCGFLLGKLYGWFCRGQFAGLLLYPFAVLSLLELPRILYWTTGRAFPSIVFLLATVFLIRDVARRAAVRHGFGRTRRTPRTISPADVQCSAALEGH